MGHRLVRGESCASGYCDTCYESAHLTATISCGHGRKVEIWYAEFGEMPEIIIELDVWLVAQNRGRS